MNIHDSCQFTKCDIVANSNSKRSKAVYENINTKGRYLLPIIFWVIDVVPSDAEICKCTNSEVTGDETSNTFHSYLVTEPYSSV